MIPNDFSASLDHYHNFTLRRIVERLRDGLFDPLGVTLLTANQEQLNQAFNIGVTKLEQNQTPGLSLCGAYGQGKSHNLTYLRQRAQNLGFVTSQINLDPRELPFHDFRLVYRALIEQISFPDNNLDLRQWWRKITSESNTNDEQHYRRVVDLIPPTMPHYFRSVLTAIALKNIPLTARQRNLKKHANFRPREFPWLLGNALKGNLVPTVRLRHALKYRQVPFYKDHSLVRRGWEPYLQALYSLAELFQTLGYKGWVILFDEGESIIQRSISTRPKSYTILDQLLNSEHYPNVLYPIFAFTDTFFMQIQNEDYERLVTRRGTETPYFSKNYGLAWQNIRTYRLNELAANEWREIAEKLTLLHARAYNQHPATDSTQIKLAKILSKNHNQEARLRIKALINQLDISQQQSCHNQSGRE
ncbi:MAG: DUF2791 family P-loop domain-containing protein [Deltaproteobacteria bacterium]|nr:DUF2791 family P-loop domain-containing protein [Candidatus Tharpella sp.]